MLVLVLPAVLFATCGVLGQVVRFPDRNLEAAVRDVLGKPLGDITATDMKTMTSFVVPGVWRVRDLSGLEHATNLTSLAIYANQVGSVSPLAGLVRLTSLILWGNQIQDISPLTGLVDLTSLYLQDNEIADISPLAGLVKLVELDLSGNRIRDLSALASLAALSHLNLEDNRVRDISPLSSLRSLTSLLLRGNVIADLEPLSGLTQLGVLWIADNEIGDISALAELVNLTWISASRNRIRDITPLVANSNARGLGTGDRLDIAYNYLDLSPGSKALNDINLLLSRGVLVAYEPQYTDAGAALSHTYGSVEGWYLISTPSPVNPFTGVTHWQWNAAGRIYERPTRLQPEMGYWARLAANTRLAVDVSAPMSDASLNLADTGWHIVSAPWMYPKSAIRVFRRGETRNWTDAVAAGWVRNAIYGYKATDGAYTMPETLHPWYGYWLRAEVSGLTLLFSYASRATSLEAPGVGDGPVARLFLDMDDLPPFPMHTLAEGPMLQAANMPNPITDVYTTTFGVLGPMAVGVTDITVTVYDLSGKLVWQGSARGAELDWHTDDLAGRYLANGVYIYQVTALVGGTTVRSGFLKLAIYR